MTPEDHELVKGLVTVSLTHPELINFMRTVAARLGDEQRQMFRILTFSVAYRNERPIS